MLPSCLLAEHSAMFPSSLLTEQCVPPIELRKFIEMDIPEAGNAHTARGDIAAEARHSYNKKPISSLDQNRQSWTYLRLCSLKPNPEKIPR